MYVDTKEAIAVTLEPSLRNLAYVLRHKEMWPKGFEWNFRYYDDCAMGLANQIWEDHPHYISTSQFFGWSDGDVDHDAIFIRPISFWKMPFKSNESRMRAVTPEIVASRIDKYLEAA